MDLQLFNFNQNQIRVVKDEQGNPLFAAKDVVDALNIKWSGAKVTLVSIKLEWQWVMKVKIQLQNRGLIFITVAAVYKLAFRSNKLESKAFTDWVAKDVLPNLGKLAPTHFSKPDFPESSKWERTFRFALFIH